MCWRWRGAQSEAFVPLHRVLPVVLLASECNHPDKVGSAWSPGRQLAAPCVKAKLRHQCHLDQIKLQEACGAKQGSFAKF